MKVSIKVTSDFLCPWCRIADARLKQVIETLPDAVEVEVNWLPFELNPDMPFSGMDRKDYRSAKFGSWEYSQRLDARTEQSAAGDGVVFNYAAIKRVPNTLAAHRLVWFTPEGAARTRLVERIFHAYFQDGKDIGDIHILADIAAENGMHRETALQFLRSNAGVEEVRQLEDLARQRHINSVPSFDIDGNQITGAVSKEELHRQIMEAHDNHQHLEVRND